MHEPQVECISKGKAHKHYEFGCKVSVADTSRGSWFVGVMAVHDNLYDRHTIKDALDQVQRVAGLPKHAFVDMGYRGHGCGVEVTVHVDKSSKGRTAKSLWRWMKRRSQHRMDRNRLKDIDGYRFNAILSDSRMNFNKLLQWAAAILRSILCWLLFYQRTSAMLVFPEA